ncbi:MAG: thiamine diphosphokinase [Oscillospiraceae bacterium]|nr:thiamine diphosphokinase [Oscillospiraceae bacterium]
MDKRICYIAGAGPCGRLDFIPGPADFVIAADGGLAHLIRNGLAADLVVGDFDSLGSVPEHPCVLTLQSEKDETDTAAALREGIGRGYRVFHLYGCAGGRLDHTLANIQLLAELSRQGMRGYLFDEKTVITAITDASIHFNAGASGTISVFSHSDKSTGVSETGLKYPLDRAELTNTCPVGVSNEFIGAESCVSVEGGTLIVMYNDV